MIDEETLAQMNGKYVCPPDAGPAWREAVRQGMDLSLIEANLDLSPWERILQNDRAVALVNEIRRCNPLNDGKPG
jgi:hypothetical protein